MKHTRYINKDLDFIFIRAKDKKGKWKSISVRELDKKQWERWLIKKFGDGKKFWVSPSKKIEKQEWTDKNKLEIINWLSKKGAIFVMISRKARKNWNKN